ncbi:protein kinase domain-containing protein [Corallococcus macrosporus]|uniref:Serine/threonine kinase family protein n=1 Tax=Myxococcus fulvus (strain ATCC BAA-855 / HW-1) TaxID=483219 RepID=F8CB11_MYXFH|nr:tetratricopeptide repeat protein [Corallococcus macrosporus]AEI68392.1 serine/threonine kinase family protein [Corallococcus macrosporus]
MACLDEATFLALATGGLPPARAAEVDAHLDACPDCRLLVAEALQAAPPLREDSLVPSEPRAPPAPGTLLAKGTEVGRYLVLERLGTGGMGVVYLAYDPELDRRVALKLLREAALGLDAEAGRAHLLREAQAMARVAHPHVVAVYDVGTFGGQVFLAMEYVESQTLRQWLRAAPRSWRQVRDIFVEAGRGLAAAHAAGLVHGDFKPENVLVGRDGRVRVTDFGLARVPVGPEAEAPRHLGGTPAYMAPEQLSGTGRVDARSDQFSFCAALHEGLYRERPFAGSTVEALAAEVRAGRVRPVPRGSDVPPWLDGVVRKGLRVDPAERHVSLDALLAALVADPAARRRRWLGWGAGLTVLLGAVGGTHALHSHRARACDGAAEAVLAGIWDGPRKQQVEAAFLGTGRPFAMEAWPRVRRALDAYTSAWRTTHGATCRATRVRGEQSEEVMAKRLRCLDRRLAEVAALTQVLAQADADVVGRAMRAVEALPSPASCADVAVMSTPEEAPDAASRQRADTLRAALTRARALGTSGRYSEGLAVLQPAVDAARAAGASASGADALLALAELREQTGDYKGAEAAVFDALSVAESGHHDDVAARAWTLAVRLSGERMEQYALAHRWRERAEAAIARLGGDDVLRARLHTNVGRILAAQGRPADADARYRQALALLERTVGPESLAVTDVLLAWSESRVAQQQEDEALALVRRALSLREKVLGPEHPEVAQALASLAEVRWYQREPGDAERLAADAVGRLERALGPDHPEVGGALNTLGVSRLVQRRPSEEVVPVFERALRLVGSRAGPETARTAVIVNNLASALNDAGRLPESIQHATRAIADLERRLGPEHPTLVPMLHELSDALCRQGRCDEAVPHLERAAAIQTALSEDLHGQWAPSLMVLGKTYLKLGRAREAVAPLARLVNGKQGLQLPPTFEAAARFFLAQALWRSATDRPRALRLATEALGQVEDTSPEGPRLRKELEQWLARHGEQRR